MKKSLVVFGLGLSVLFIGCGQQPEIEINDSNQTEQNQTVPQVENNVTVPENNVSSSPVVIEDTPIEENLASSSVNVEEENGDLRDASNINENNTQNLASILVSKKIYFDFDKYNIRDDMVSKIDELVAILKEYSDKTFTLRIEGNCDEWGSDEYNYALGLKRAKTVKTYLIDNGIDASKLTLISYGESNPVCTEHTKKCWQKNRRVEFTLLP